MTRGSMTTPRISVTAEVGFDDGGGGDSFV